MKLDNALLNYVDRLVWISLTKAPFLKCHMSTDILKLDIKAHSRMMAIKRNQSNIQPEVTRIGFQKVSQKDMIKFMQYVYSIR